MPEPQVFLDNDPFAVNPCFLCPTEFLCSPWPATVVQYAHHGLPLSYSMLTMACHCPASDPDSAEFCLVSLQDSTLLNKQIVQPFFEGDMAWIRGLLPKFLWRHSKKDVAHELEIPAQQDVTLNVTLSSADRKAYSDAYRAGKRQIERHMRELVRRKSEFDNDPHTAGRKYTGPAGIHTGGVVSGVMSGLRQICCHSLVAKDAGAVLGGNLRCADSVAAQLLSFMNSQCCVAGWPASQAHILATAQRPKCEFARAQSLNSVFW